MKLKPTFILVLGSIAVVGVGIVWQAPDRSTSVYASPPAGPPSPNDPLRENLRPMVMPADVVLQQRVRTFNWTPNSPDIANGRPVSGELLIRTSSDGQAIEFGGAYRIDEGAPYQTVYATLQTESVRNNPPLRAGLGTQCEFVYEATESLEYVVPRVVDVRALPATSIVDANMTAAGQVIDSRANDVGYLVTESYPDGTIELSAVIDGESGALRAFRSIGRDLNGNVLNDHWESAESPAVSASQDVGGPLEEIDCD